MQVMAYCPDRSIRWTTHLGDVMRGSKELDMYLSTATQVRDIRKHRQVTFEFGVGEIPSAEGLGIVEIPRAEGPWNRKILPEWWASRGPEWRP